MSDYYSEKLAADRLRQVYEIAAPRVRQYLDAEVAFVLKHIRPGDNVLELGCGYGRILPALASVCGYAAGIDTALASVAAARRELIGVENLGLAVMDASQTGFAGGVFDVVVCIQNGISAFHVDPKRLIAEAVRVTKPGGVTLFSSYAKAFWPERLAWFEAQSRAELLGPIDYTQTGDGVIVCTDGFRATTVDPEQFMQLGRELKLTAHVEEVDSSSVFCVYRRPAG